MIDKLDNESFQVSLSIKVKGLILKKGDFDDELTGKWMPQLIRITKRRLQLWRKW